MPGSISEMQQTAYNEMCALEARKAPESEYYRCLRQFLGTESLTKCRSGVRLQTLETLFYALRAVMKQVGYAPRDLERVFNRKQFLILTHDCLDEYKEKLVDPAYGDTMPNG